MSIPNRKEREFQRREQAILRAALALFDRSDEFAGDCVTTNSVLELETRTAFSGHDFELDDCELAGTTRLLDVLTGPVRCSRDGFLVGDLRTTDIRIDAELAEQAVDDDFEMKLTHAGNDQLARLAIGRNLE